MEIDVGRVVAGKYELVRLLGRGSMGEVWVAHHKSLGEHVAIKLLSQSPAAPGEEIEDPATAAARFRFEAQVAAKLSRKTRHIVRVTDHGEEEGSLAYLVMELLEGETLDAVLVRDTRVRAETVVTIVAQVARALSYAHAEGVFHRDLKPANLFLARDEEGQLLVKLLDFGIARAAHAHRARSAVTTAKGLIFGTPSYMSPEQALGSAKLDFRCDLWALATIAYEVMTGDLPVDGQDTDELLQNLCAGRIVPLRRRDPKQSPAVEAFFARAFSEAIGLRFQSAAELANAFAAAVAASNGTQAIPARVDSTPQQPAPAPAAASTDAIALRGRDSAVSELEIDEAVLARRRGRSRLAVVAGAGAVVALLAVALAWRALVQAPSAAADTTSGQGAAHPTPPSPPPATSQVQAPAGATTSTAPGVPVSALPRAPAPPSQGQGQGQGLGIGIGVGVGHGAAVPGVPAATAPGATSVPPQPGPAAPPAPASAQGQAQKKLDKSEVF